MSAIRRAIQAFLVLSALTSAACTTQGSLSEEGEAVSVEPETAAPEAAAPGSGSPDEAVTGPEDKTEEGEVPIAVAETEHREETPSGNEIAEVIVQARARHEVIHDLVAEAQTLLRDVQLQYYYTGKGKREAGPCPWSCVRPVSRRCMLRAREPSG